MKIGDIEIVEPRQIVYDILKFKNAGTAFDLGAGNNGVRDAFLYKMRYIGNSS